MTDFETATHYLERQHKRTHISTTHAFTCAMHSFQPSQTPAKGSAQMLQICNATWLSYSNEKEV